MRNRTVVFLICASMLTQMAMPAFGYSVLTHEEIIDIAWKSDIAPLILKKFPSTTAEQMKEAHAYAYGGSIIQDLGYYPHGSKQFSDLVHYVRTGDFVRALLKDANDANEYAFALGALAHYTSDLIGHPAVNSAVAIEFPKLQKKYGDKVTYAENKTAHLQTEFGFDMDQVAKHRYTSDNYHDFIGFKVAKDVLDRAFLETYGIKVEDALPNEDRAIESYRHAVSQLIPQMTRVALRVRNNEISKEIPNNTRRQFLYNLRKADYEKEFGTNYFKETFKTRFLAFLVRLLPKIGPLRALGFKNPTAKTEDLYFKSINATISHYQELLKRLATHDFKLTDADLDTGVSTRKGEYDLADKTYTDLLKKLADQDFQTAPKELRQNMLAFFDGPPVSPGSAPENKDPRKDSEDTLKLLERLRSAPPPIASPVGNK